MKNWLAAASMAALLMMPAYAQSPTAPTNTTAVVESQEPIPVPPDAPQGSSTPKQAGVAAGVGVGVGVVVLGLLLLSTMAFMPSS